MTGGGGDETFNDFFRSAFFTFFGTSSESETSIFAASLASTPVSSFNFTSKLFSSLNVYTLSFTFLSSSEAISLPNEVFITLSMVRSKESFFFPFFKIFFLIFLSLGFFTSRLLSLKSKS
uniref:Uncharacterized protein n=1 Tax=Tetranychus urticae TaxID=32264 RepID=T1KAE2_TETUR